MKYIKNLYNEEIKKEDKNEVIDISYYFNCLGIDFYEDYLFVHRHELIEKYIDLHEDELNKKLIDYYTSDSFKIMFIIKSYNCDFDEVQDLVLNGEDIKTAFVLSFLNNSTKDVKNIKYMYFIQDDDLKDLITEDDIKEYIEEYIDEYKKGDEQK